MRKVMAMLPVEIDTMRAKIKRLSKRIASLKKKSERSKKT